MDQKGDIVSEEAAALLKTKKVEFQQASNALAVINNVNAWALDMRLHEKIYMLNHEQMALNTIGAQYRQPFGRIRRPGKAEPG